EREEFFRRRLADTVPVVAQLLDEFLDLPIQVGIGLRLLLSPSCRLVPGDGGRHCDETACQRGQRCDSHLGHPFRAMSASPALGACVDVNLRMYPETPRKSI